MKIRTALAALAAVAALALTACGSETAGTAAPVAGAERAAPAASEEPGADPSADAPSEEAPSEEAPTGESDETTDGGDTTAAPDAGGCQQLATLAQDFSTKILQKATQGGVTQADVDEVFSDENMAALPAELQEDAATLKDLSQQMVGKEITELAEILPQVQTTFQSIADKAGSACSGG